MIRRCLCVTSFAVCLSLLAAWAAAHGPGGSCDGSCQSGGGSPFAPSAQQQSSQPAYAQQQFTQQQAYQQPYPQQPFTPSSPGYYGQSRRTFAGPTADDCPICRGEREQDLAVGPHNFAGATQFPGPRPLDTSNMDPSFDRPRLPALNSARQPGFPMADPYSRGHKSRGPRREPGPIPHEPARDGREFTTRPAHAATSSAAIPDGMALVLQDDSPLMNAADQLGSIDRGQTLRVLNVQGNWVQLETSWLGKNTWIRRNLVQLNDNIQPQNDIAPPAL